MNSIEKHVYHLVPSQVHGSTLYPLNQLYDVAPELAARAARKYVGREEVMGREVPSLDCKWGDVLMFCPIHPLRIMETFREYGYDLKPRKWFAVPMRMLDRANTAVFFSQPRKRGDFTLEASQFAPMNAVEFATLTDVPEALRQHIQMARAENRTPFLFVGVPHILYRGSLSLEEIEIVEF